MTLLNELKALEKERADLKERFKEHFDDLDRAIEGIQIALRLKGIDIKTSIAKGNGASHPQLYNVLMGALQDHRSHSVQNLVEIAKEKGVEFGEKSPGRSVAFTLLGISRGGTIDKNLKGKWHLVRE